MFITVYSYTASLCLISPILKMSARITLSVSVMNLVRVALHLWRWRSLVVHKLQGQPSECCGLGEAGAPRKSRAGPVTAQNSGQQGEIRIRNVGMRGNLACNDGLMAISVSV